MRISAKVQNRVHASREAIMDCIINKDKLCNFFVSHSSSDLSSGAKVHWKWEDYNAETDVEVVSISPEQIVFKWPNIEKITTVTITIKEFEDYCDVIITEDDFLLNEEGAKQIMNQCQGWTDFICSLKAYLYCDINLRKDPRK
ncbi:SRPBCC domain-containing protein [Luteibaculum oceani]|uniref:Activator of Hsp90 ATPase homologue 1/2-like C-terminal domain-containing protein n=1 Tax=Luteibaculum oceani TaxID=1294296 RepID=A0A5C6US28_9FLAO|nr:SRPBCC domain-containing protein [Luteibaculum oceani]TXC76132.1 hypothetical protein FRX97_11510 [Luteibaculum oceani]